MNNTMKMMKKNLINAAIQVLPVSDEHDSYDLVDIAIAEIEKSGLKYKVCPFETAVEGEWDEVMALVKRIHDILYQNGTKKMMCYLKIQSNQDQDVRIEDKMHKYE